MGFTLVELLIAATMMAVLLVGLSAHLRGGITVWQRATTTVERLQRQDVALDRLASDLANSLIDDPRPESYGGAPGQLPVPHFTATSAAWYAAQPAAPGRVPSVRFVSYACAARDGTQGLWRTSQSIGEVRTNTEPVPELLMPGCESLTFRYGTQAATDSHQPDWLAWIEEWPNALQAMPRLVEVSMQLAGGHQVMRLLTIPIGTVHAPEHGPAAPPG